MDDEEVEYEFEYDALDTESFYLELDLSTTNRGTKEHLKRKKYDGHTVNSEENHPDMGRSQQRRAILLNGDGPNTSQTQNIRHEAESNPAAADSSTGARSSSIQLLDLHSPNPVVSYQNQIYSCSWSDMIGTAMFFGSSQDAVEESALLTTDDFHLINTSRIKVVGQKAKLTGKPGRKRPRPQDEGESHVISSEIDEEDTSLVSGKSLGGIRTNNATINAGIKRQAAFLEKMMEIKRSKGEPDNVRTVFNPRTRDVRTAQPRIIDSESFRKGHEFSSTAQEVEDLNRRVVRGDAAALMRLQDIYSSMEGDGLNPVPSEKDSWNAS